MRTMLLSCITAIMLLGGCSKNNTVINFNCLINGTAVNGNAVTYYNGASSPTTFQVTMNGANNQAVTIVWYNLSSISAESSLTGIYTMPAHPLPPFTIAGTYVSQYGYSTYNTGTGNNLSGTVTITNNTGPGGVISGTFNFNGLNTVNNLDTIHITQGTFTNVPVVTS